MSRKVHADLQAIAARLSPSSGGRGRHSPLFRYLYERADAFKRLLDEKRPAWSAITSALASEGLTNGDGQPLTRRRVQKTWYAVEIAKWRPPHPAVARKQSVEDADAPASQIAVIAVPEHQPRPVVPPVVTPVPDA